MESRTAKILKRVSFLEVLVVCENLAFNSFRVPLFGGLTSYASETDSGVEHYNRELIRKEQFGIQYM